MTLGAILRAFHVERLLTVVAFAAKVSFGDLGHVHLIGPLCHLKNLVMTTGALDPFSLNMKFMAERDGTCVLRGELDVTSTNLLRSCCYGNYEP